MAEAILALLFGLGASVAAIVYRMRAMERRGEFDRERNGSRRKP